MEAAAQSRRLRLEELKRRKEAESSTRNGVGAAASGTRQAASDGVEESASMIRFDDADMKAIASGADVEEGDSLEDVFRAWSTAKLVRSFRVLDRRLRIDYDKLKDTVEKDVAGIEENVIQQDEARRQEELDLHNIAPKRPNWDLKRDMNKRLAKLERRDKEARLILIRQRVAAAGKDGGEGAGSAQSIAAGAVGSGGLLGAAVAGHASDSDSDVDEDE